jgi:hypothetical protein
MKNAPFSWFDDDHFFCIYLTFFDSRKRPRDSHQSPKKGTPLIPEPLLPWKPLIIIGFYRFVNRKMAPASSIFHIPFLYSDLALFPVRAQKVIGPETVRLSPIEKPMDLRHQG